MLAPSRVTLLLCCAWAATLLYGEMVTYWLPLWTCSWPNQQPHAYSSGTTGTENQQRRVNVAVLADPQLMDWTSLRLPRQSMLLATAKFYTDLYMRRSFLLSIMPHKPDVVLFLGDQFDGAPFLSDQEWEESLNRFKHVFYVKERPRDSDIRVYYLSGNHDIGYSGLHSHYPEVITRFERGFGSRNYRFTSQKVDFVAVDAQTLDGPGHGLFTSSTWEFIKNVSKDQEPNPKVLLTHIPLYRPDETPCGPHRTSPIVNQRVSHAGQDKEIMYQNYLSQETSQRLLELIKPMLVLSGHDHDQCSVTHLTSSESIIEHTLGTVSWQQGNLYLCLFAVTLGMAVFWPSSGIGSLDRWMQELRSLLISPKEKDEDKEGEYEMVWDAEGSMHLVKKAASRDLPSSSSDTVSFGRGNALVRSVMRKHLQKQEREASIALDVKELPETIGKSRAGRSVFHPLVRVFRMLSVIALVNVPLYIMLLFKDWI